MVDRWRTPLLIGCYFLAIILFAKFIYSQLGTHYLSHPHGELMLSLDGYKDAHLNTITETLLYRIKEQPFNLVALLIFITAIFHTFIAHYFTVLSKKLRDRNIQLKLDPIDSFSVEFFRFMGEIEVVFGIWVIPLFWALAITYNWNAAIQYLESVQYIEPMFVVVIMTLSSTSPILQLAENCLRRVAKLGGESTKAWWWTILTFGPIAGSLITEPGAMTISAILLSKQFYELKPSPRFAYATLGLLFTNVSVGGVLTNFAAPPVLMVSYPWHWDSLFMFTNFGWKAIIGILVANSAYYLLFRKEFKELDRKKEEVSRKEQRHHKKKRLIPLWITLVHVGLLAWMVFHNHHPVMFLGCFLLFLGFYNATLPYQDDINLKPAVLVGFFLVGLVIHGNLQGWWIAPLLAKANQELLLVLSAFLTSFNDNAEITFLATLIPNFPEALKYVVVAGAVTGGGLTIIANAPNPSGQAILGKHFYQGISAFSLLAGALFPAIIMGLCFYYL